MPTGYKAGIGTLHGVRALLLHGWQGNSPGHWQTWLAEQLDERGEHVQYPDLPDCDQPCPDRWGARLHAELNRLAAEPGERVVIAHSLGCVLWLREAHNISPAVRVDRVALVAPPCPNSRVPELAGFYPTGVEREAVHAAATETVLICSDDDPYCPGEAADVYWAARLGIERVLLPGAGHINVESGHGPWPYILDWTYAGTNQGALM